MAKFVASYQQIAAFSAVRFNPIVMAENARVKVILACFEPGQFIPVHQPGVDLTLMVLEGEGVLVAGEQESPISRGAMAFVPAGEKRGIKAETRLIVLHVVCPPPTEADHTQVAAGLKRGAWK